LESTKKLFNLKAITIATYFGGPLAAGYLVKKNFETFDDSENGKKVFIIGIISTILIFAGIFSMPEHIIDKIPNAIIPAIYTGIIYLIVEKIQGKKLKEHKESGGEFYSAWKATGIGAIFMLILVVMIAGTAFIMGDLSEADFDTTTYDKEVAKFVQNENESLAVYNVIDSAEPQYLIQEFKKGNVLWEENKEIVKKLNAIENLPKELLEQNKILLSYCDLRIQHNNIIVKAISEDTDKYASEIDKIGMEINKVLKELEEFKK
jgi:hypothetical protein